MAEVTLNEYCEEAKELIRSDFYNQAIGICRHILEHFPKHGTSYRLLGETCLEQEDYVEAANLFKRVLSIDLEDVISYVGLGIIYDQQGALEEAIWQLERAFELTPGNAEIRAELQRLYGDRDGTPRPRLKLTPAALGRLYLKEELYQRAVDEFKSVLEEDPERVDMQVPLAEALWWSDQRREAAEICEDILEKLPNCLKANLILGEILLNSGREEEGRTLLRTAQAVDPENIVAQVLFRDQSPLPLESVYVRRLDKAELEEGAREISAEAAEPEEKVKPAGEALPSIVEAELEEEMPGWLRRLREGEKQPAAEEAVAPAQAEEMPDWLRELEKGMPGEPEGAVAAGEEGPPPVEETPSWLRELEEVSEAPRPEEISPPVVAEEEEAAAPPEPVVEEKPAEAREPMWEEMEKESSVIAALEEELSTIGEEVAEISEETMARLRETMPDESASIEEIMAWMERSEAIIAEDKPLEEAIEEAAPPTEEVPDWLRELKAEAVEEEVVSPAEAEEEIPDWLRALKGEPVEPVSPEEEVAPEAGEAPPWLRESREEAPGEKTTAFAEEMASPPEEVVEEKPAEKREPMWEEMEKESPVMAALEEEFPSVEEDVVEISEETMARMQETMPDESASTEEITAWMERSKAIMAEEQAPPDTMEAVEEGMEVPPKEVEEVPPPGEEEEVPAWLQELRAGAREEEVAAPPEEVEAPVEEVAAPSEEEVPTWLRELRTEAAKEEVAAPSEEVEAPVEEVAVPSEEEVPTWLRELRTEAAKEEVAAPPEEVEAPVEEVAIPSEEEVPAWLRELRAEAAKEEVAAPPEEVEAPVEEVVEEAVAPVEEEAGPIPAEEAIPPAFVEEAPLVEIVSVEEEEVAEVAPVAEKMEEEVAEVVEVTGVGWSIGEYLNHLASNPKDHKARLALARAYLQDGDLDQAVLQYGEIVSSGILRDEVIDDLEATADDAPDHLPTHELLADAYVKDGRLQKALDKYRWLRVKLAD